MNDDYLILDAGLKDTGYWTHDEGFTIYIL